MLLRDRGILLEFPDENHPDSQLRRGAGEGSVPVQDCGVPHYVALRRTRADGFLPRASELQSHRSQRALCLHAPIRVEQALPDTEREYHGFISSQGFLPALGLPDD